MKKTIIFIMLILMSITTLAYTSTANCITTANITIEYNGGESGSITLNTHGHQKSYSLTNQSDSIIIDYQQVSDYFCPSENVSEACSQIASQYNTILPYLNDTRHFADKYASASGEVSGLKEDVLHWNDRRKICEDTDLPNCENQLKSIQDSYNRYFTEYKLCQSDYTNCFHNLNNETALVEEVEGTRITWSFLGLILGAIAVWYFGIYVKKPKTAHEATEISTESSPHERATKTD